MAGTHSQAFYILGVHSLIIPEAELPSLEHEALKGSPDAAFRLHRYYQSVRLDFGSTPVNRGHAATATPSRSIHLGRRPRRLGATQRGNGIW